MADPKVAEVNQDELDALRAAEGDTEEIEGLGDEGDNEVIDPADKRYWDKARWDRERDDIQASMIAALQSGNQKTIEEISAQHNDYLGQRKGHLAILFKEENEDACRELATLIAEFLAESDFDARGVTVNSVVFRVGESGPELELNPTLVKGRAPKGTTTAATGEGVKRGGGSRYFWMYAGTKYTTSEYCEAFADTKERNQAQFKDGNGGYKSRIAGEEISVRMGGTTLVDKDGNPKTFTEDNKPAWLTADLAPKLGVTIG